MTGSEEASAQVRSEVPCTCGTTRPTYTVLPNTDQPLPSHECDLVLKGGLASGVVYARAIPLLAGRYTFRSIGGASAGAAGAVFAAACEYSRTVANTDVAFTEFGNIGATFEKQPRQVTAVFRPTSLPRRALFVALFHQRIRYLVIVAWLVTPVLTMVFHKRIKSVALFLTRWAGPITFLLLAALFCLLRYLPRVVPTENWPVTLLGLGSGTRRRRQRERDVTKYRQRRKHRLPLTDWMHHQVQAASNRSCNSAPLTFAELASVSRERPIDLRIVVTDLKLRRRVVFPARSDTPDYHYDSKELRTLFPKPLVDYLDRHSPQPIEVAVRSPGKRRHTRELRRLPTDQLPIVVAARASAGFPGLFCPVPLWTIQSGKGPDEDEDPNDTEYDGMVIGRRHLLVDGGASQNFPVSMFDSWVPSRPTFGVRPRRHRGLRLGKPNTGAIASYISSLFDTLVNGHDELQAVLPGYKERNIDITLQRGLGEMNFWPSKADITKMLDAADHADRTFFHGADAWDWDKHRRGRFDLVMEQLETKVRGGAGPGTTLEVAMRTALRRELETSQGPNDGRKAEAADRLIAVIDSWAPQAEPLFTCSDDQPSARGVLRIAPE